jgi:hypothetical protein
VEDARDGRDKDDGGLEPQTTEDGRLVWRKTEMPRRNRKVAQRRKRGAWGQARELNGTTTKRVRRKTWEDLEDVEDRRDLKERKT